MPEETEDIRAKFGDAPLAKLISDGTLEFTESGLTLFHPKQTEPVYVDTGDGEVAEVVVSDMEYEICRAASWIRMWAREKSNRGYTAGVANSEQDPRNVMRTGRLGETALAKLVGGNVDLTYYDGGESADMIVHGKKCDIKTAVHLPDLREGLILAFNEKGPAPLKSDVYLVAYKHSEDRKEGIAVIRIVGAISKQNIEKNCSQAYSRRGPWINWSVPYSELIPIRKVLEWARGPENVV